MSRFSDPRRLLALRLRGVRSEMLSQGAPFDYEVPELGVHLKGTQFSVYDPRFSPYRYTTRQAGTIIANNTYLTGFVDNIALVWLCHAFEVKAGREGSFRQLLCYNLKKFYAEQLYRYRNTAFARALLLETLLFEEPMMRAVFARQAAEPALLAAQQEVRDTANALFLFHEIAHEVQDQLPDFRARMLSETPGADIAAFWDRHPAALGPEFEADAYAAHMALHQGSELYGASDLRRVCAFCFALFEIMISLDASARLTAETAAPEEDADILDDIHGAMTGASYVLDHHPDALARRHSALHIIEAHARAENEPFFAEDGAFPMPESLPTLLHDFLPKIIAHGAPPYRAKCELLARSFHGHQRGFEFLLWRSKTFTLPTESVPETS